MGRYHQSRFIGEETQTNERATRGPHTKERVLRIIYETTEDNFGIRPESLLFPNGDTPPIVYSDWR